MAKDPAFLFYPGDFNTGTQFFTDEQVGKYMRLLMAQHQHGHLSEKHVLHICKTYDKDVMNKFIKDKDGLWYNERLDNEMVKRKEYSLSRSKNRSSKNDISKTYVQHMENENRNKDKDDNIKETHIGNVNGHKIIISAKYANESPVVIHDIQEYFKETGQLEAIQRAGWVKFKEFMSDNPDAYFNDKTHLYNSFRNFHKKHDNNIRPNKNNVTGTGSKHFSGEYEDQLR